MKKQCNPVHQIHGDDFFGQDNNKKVIFTMIEAVSKRGEQPGHILLYGSEGRGKKFFADIIAQKIGNKTSYIDGGSNTILYSGDLAGILTNLDKWRCR